MSKFVICIGVLVDYGYSSDTEGRQKVHFLTHFSAQLGKLHFSEYTFQLLSDLSSSLVSKSNLALTYFYQRKKFTLHLRNAFTKCTVVWKKGCTILYRNMLAK